MKRTIMALAMVLTASVANAQSNKPASREDILKGMSGVGYDKCSLYVEHSQGWPNPNERQVFEVIYLTWAEGYMSGLNLYSLPVIRNLYAVMALEKPHTCKHIVVGIHRTSLSSQ
jgi:hypothetical protein